MEFLMQIRFSFQIIVVLFISFQISYISSRSLSKHSSTNSSKNVHIFPTSSNDVISFDLPGSPPIIPSGGPEEGFGQNSIDLGGLKVSETLYFTKIWGTYEGGESGSGISFYEPSQIEGYYILGHFGQPNDGLLYASVLVGKDTSGLDPNNGTLKMPVGYTLVWSSVGKSFKKDGEGYIWLPIPPDGYSPVGHIVTTSPDEPSLDRVRCVRDDFTAHVVVDSQLWDFDELHVYSTKPLTTGPKSMSVSVGTFMANNNNSGPFPLACLRTHQTNFTAFPNYWQIKALMQAYSPWIYFHPDEEYLPSNVSWFFENGALIYRTGQSNPQPIVGLGWNLPTNGLDSDSYIDLPLDEEKSDFVKRGNLQIANAYVHVKPAFGGTFTDIAIWVFYPFNGPATIQVGPFTLRFKKVGEHVGDWEHVTLRISNFNSRLKCIYLSQHKSGKWLSAKEFEYYNGRPVVYAAKDSHAFYPNEGHNIHSNVLLPASVGLERFRVGARNDTAKSDMVMDVASHHLISQVETFNFLMEPWFFYTGRWGPTRVHTVEYVLKAFLDIIPSFLRHVADKLVHKLPKEFFVEEGPTGPMMKDNWSGDENV